MKQCNNGSLDVVTGFHIVDKNFRLIVVEGLAAGSMSRLESAILREDANSSSIKILRNRSVRFTHRLYSKFNVDLKVVHIRDPLEHMVKYPDIYDRNIVDKQCYDALMSLVSIRSAACLREIAASQAFPQADMLISLESVYGEAVSLEDIEGKKVQRRASTMLKFQMSTASEDATASSRRVRSVPSDHSKHSAAPTRRKAATDCHNPAYMLARSQRSSRDYLKEHTQTRLEVVAKAKEARAAREAAGRTRLKRAGEKRDIHILWSKAAKH